MFSTRRHTTRGPSISPYIQPVSLSIFKCCETLACARGRALTISEQMNSRSDDLFISIRIISIRAGWDSPFASRARICLHVSRSIRSSVSMSTACGPPAQPPVTIVSSHPLGALPSPEKKARSLLPFWFPRGALSQILHIVNTRLYSKHHSIIVKQEGVIPER